MLQGRVQVYGEAVRHYVVTYTLQTTVSVDEEKEEDMGWIQDEAWYHLFEKSDSSNPPGDDYNVIVTRIEDE